MDITPRTQRARAIDVFTARQLAGATRSGYAKAGAPEQKAALLSAIDAAAKGRSGVYLSDLYREVMRTLTCPANYPRRFLAQCRKFSRRIEGFDQEMFFEGGHWENYVGMGGWRSYDLMAQERKSSLRTTEVDLPFLPSPSRAFLMVTDVISPGRMTPTAFVLPVDDRGVWLANNRRRGLEIPGGHVEPGEHTRHAARREALEETGIIVNDLKPVAVKVCHAHHGMRPKVKPEGYRYPYPTSCMQFYLGQAASVNPYVENDECLSPRHVTWEDVDAILGMTDEERQEREPWAKPWLVEILKEARSVRT